MLGANGKVRVEAVAPEGERYAVQQSSDLARWQRVAALPCEGAAALIECEQDTAANAGFYRLRRESTLFRFNLRHDGNTGSYGIPSTNVTVKWKFKTGDHVVASPAVVAGVVYIGSVDTNFYAIDAESGVEKWRFTTGGPIRSSAAVLDGVVYFSSRDGLLRALKAEDGSELWNFRIANTNQTESFDNWDYFDSSPAVVDGVLYVGSGDTNIYAVDARTGQQIWKFPTKRRVASSPAVVDGVVFCGSLDGYMYAISAETGTNLWKLKTQGNGGFPVGEIFHAPAVVDGLVYFGSRDSGVYAVDAVTGKRVWRRDVAGGGSWAFNSPAVYNGLVLAGTSIPGYLCALDTKTGIQKWQISMPNSLQEYSSPAVAEGIAYFGVGDALSTCTSRAHPRAAPAYFLAVDIAAKKIKWRFRTDGHVWSSPSVVEGTVFFGCLDGYVYALNEAQPTPPPQ
jgi:outer membrane protein assembly factor BamB